MARVLDTPLRGVGEFFALTLDTFVSFPSIVRQGREFVEQSWFIARVSMLATVLVAIPFTVLVSFTLNILLREIGAADLSGAGAALGAVTQVGPMVTVLIVAGAGATAICADLGARTIREEIDAMEVLGIDPVKRLVVPRVAASTFVALMLNGLVCTIGILGGSLFSVLLQGVNPGVRQRHHAAHGLRRAHAGADQGGDVRHARRSRRLLQGSLRPGRAEGRRQRGQRDRRLRVHGPVRRQHGAHRRGRQGPGGMR